MILIRSLQIVILEGRHRLIVSRGRTFFDRVFIVGV